MGQSNTYVIVLILLAIGLSHCKKKSLPDPVDGEPFFEFSGAVDGQSTMMQAGVDSFYMFTGFRQSSIGLYSFYGNLDRLDCQGCGPGLQIEFFDKQNRPMGAAISAAEVLRTGSYDFVQTAAAPPSGKKLQFFADSSFIRGPTAFHWSFMLAGVVQTSTDPNPIMTFSQNGVVQVCLTLTDSLGCQSSNCNDVVVQDIPPVCNAFFTYDYLQQNVYQFHASNASPAIQYHWDFGDSSFSTLSNPVKNYAVGWNPPFRVCLEVTSGNCSATHCMLVADPNSTHCLANFRYAAVQDSVTQQMDRVQLTWINQQGAEYSSFRAGGQPGTSQFTIQNISEYEVNDHGELTRSYTFEVDAWLYHVNHPNDSIPIKGSGTYAVAYPQ